MAKQKDYEIEKGATFSHVLRWYNPDGTPVNLTGFSGRMQIRKILADGTPDLTGGGLLLELTTGNGRISLETLTGKITLTIDAATTAGLTFLAGIYDLELVNAPYVKRLVQGQITVTPEVTI